MENLRLIIDNLKNNKDECNENIASILRCEDEDINNYLFSAADEIRKANYGNAIYIRGLIEISSYCKNNCLYCGIRLANKKPERYRLSKGEILACCKAGYELGFRTFVMQGGEDNSLTDEFICDAVSSIKNLYSDCAVTLSIGERSKESYKKMRDAGADRYLLRHETATKSHYEKLHPKSMSFKKRIECLYNLKELGYQVGCGVMVGSPYQTIEHLINDLRFMQELSPQMIGIGPYITHKDTPFKNYKSGDLYLTLRMLAITRLMFPKILLPATTALGSIDKNGRILGLKAGCNVVMPNLSPTDVRKLYTLYDNKAYSGAEAAESLNILKDMAHSVGYEVVCDRGDYIGY